MAGNCDLEWTDRWGQVTPRAMIMLVLESQVGGWRSETAPRTAPDQPQASTVHGIRVNSTPVQRSLTNAPKTSAKMGRPLTVQRSCQCARFWLSAGRRGTKVELGLGSPGVARCPPSGAVPLNSGLCPLSPLPGSADERIPVATREGRASAAERCTQRRHASERRRT